MEHYDPKRREHRSLVENWYWTLKESHEFLGTFHHSFGTPESFVHHFDQGNLLFTQFKGHMISALWFYPWFDGVEMGLWVDPHHRHSKVVREMRIDFEQALRAFPVIVSCTIRPEVEKLLLHLGFVHTGSIPYAWDEQTVEAYYITKELYDVKQKQHR